MSETLALPTFLPGGQSLLMDHDFVRRLHEGDASVGWAGDERLGVYHADNRIEIWRHEEHGEMSLVMRSRPGLNILGTQALRHLAEHDSRSRRKYSAVADVRTHNERLARDRDAIHAAKMGEVADRLHFALRKDLGAYEGGLRHRQMPLPAAPWKKDDTK